jgi:hypothetical protein
MADSLPYYWPAALVMLAGLAAFCALAGWDTRLQRRQAPVDDAGIGLFRSDEDDTTEAELDGMLVALRAATSDLPPPPPRREPVVITRSPYAYRQGWRTPPTPPLRPVGHGPITLQFQSIARAATGVVPELGPDEPPAWVAWTAAERPLLAEVL